MDDDKLKSIFTDYSPHLSSGRNFCSQVERSMRSIDIVRQETKAARRLNSRALVIAALAGFVIGILFSRFMPDITDGIARWGQMLPAESILPSITAYASTIAWMLTAALSIAAALSAYALTAHHRAASGSLLFQVECEVAGD